MPQHSRPSSGHLGGLGKLRSKLVLLEAQASVLDDWEVERRHRGQLLKAARPASTAADMVSELKTYLEAVVDADQTGDPLLASITQEHCINYAVKVITDFDDGAVPPGKGTHGLLELASSTLCSLSQRPAAHALLLSSGAIPALISLLLPSHTSCAVSSAASALGNLSADAGCRRALRSHGGVGALVRLMRADAPGAMQAAAASALCLMAARDPIVQDSVRYLGGIDLLVELLAAPRASVAKVARYCLASLQHGNPRNEADIIQAVRLSPSLAKDFGRLREALEALQGGGGSGGAGGSDRGAGRARGPTGGVSSGGKERARLLRALERENRRLEAELDEMDGEGHGRSAERSLRSSARCSLEAAEQQLVRANADAARATVHAASTGRVRPLSAAVAATAALVASAAAAAAATAAAAAVRGSCLAAVPSRRPAKSPLGKHMLGFTSEEVCALLSELGWGSSDLRGVRKDATTGAELMVLIAASACDPTCSDLAARLRVPPHKARRLRRLSDATALFDAISTRPSQPRLSEVELRLWLAGSGCSCAEVGRVMKLLRSLVVRNDDAEFITYWDWAVGWQWVTHALELYGVDWRAALCE